MWEAVPPPELHCMMGAVNHLLELARKFLERNGQEEELWKWCDGKGITRRGYNGKNKLDGNNTSRFLREIDGLASADWFPSAAIPILDCLQAFQDIKDKCFGWMLEDGWRKSIQTFTAMFAELQEYAAMSLGLSLTVTWKIHVVCCHLETFLNKVI